MSGVAAADRLAAHAGATLLAEGGNAVDAAVATAAAMAVVAPHMCGLGGDLFALVHRPGAEPVALNASGRAGSGADAAALRRELSATGADGRGAAPTCTAGARMPHRGDIRSVTVPGCVDGLAALAARLGRRPLAESLRPAITLAERGFAVAPGLAAASHDLAPELRRAAFATSAPLREGAPLTLPGIARVLRDVAEGGRSAFYEGAVGAELMRLGAGLFDARDLQAPQADWVTPLSLEAFGHRLWTIPPNSQGYLTLAAAWIADAIGVVAEPDDPRWVFTLVEAARQAGHDRPAVLHDHADGFALIAPERLAPRAAAIADRASAGLSDTWAAGDTTYLCVVDDAGLGVSLILSNAAGFGAHLVLPESGISLHNRGSGFSLTEGHPAEYGPGRRPPHTLSPALVTRADGTLRTVLGTMGGDAQPQILLQLLARTLLGGADPEAAITAPRWVLSRPDPTTGFDTWDDPTPPLVRLEPGAPPAWVDGLRERGYEVVADTRAGGFGHAQLIECAADGTLAGAADPRSGAGAFLTA